MYERMNIEDWKAKKKNDRDAVLADQKQSRAVRPATLADTAGHAAGRMAVRGGYADRQPDEPAICEHLLKRA